MVPTTRRPSASHGIHHLRFRLVLSVADAVLGALVSHLIVAMAQLGLAAIQRRWVLEKEGKAGRHRSHAFVELGHG